LAASETIPAGNEIEVNEPRLLVVVSRDIARCLEAPLGPRPILRRVSSTDYVHGYGTPEQERLVAQAEHWRQRLIRDGTQLDPGTRLLEVGCGVGAVLAVLGHEFSRLRLTGVDIEPKQLEFARGHLERSGVEATLVEADALALPFADESFDHVWMMWFLEHVADPPAVLREARRVLAPGGGITAIEVDYSTCRAEPSTAAIEALIRAMVQGMAASGWSDAGTRLPGWLRETGFREVDEGERAYWWRDDDLAGQARYASDVLESALDALAQLPGADEQELRAGLRDLRGLPSQPGAGLGWVVHKSTAVRPARS
jgi:ubiquinone/menaquinone biosynthesis C-methylase UbiE